MSGSCDLLETSKTPVVYTVRDTIKRIKYYFVQPMDTDLVSIFETLSKSNSKISSLTAKIRKLMIECYPNDNLLSSLEADLKAGTVFSIIPFFLNGLSSILDVKRKLMNVTGIYYGDIHLWANVVVNNNQYSKRLAARYGVSGDAPNKFTKLKYLPQFDYLDCKTRVSLGIEYESSLGLELIDPDPKNLTSEIPSVNVIDTQTLTLGSYNITNNEISMMDYNT